MWNCCPIEGTLDTLMPNAPQVVAVIVVHDPGTWFQEMLDSLRDTDYPNLSFIFVDTSTDVVTTDSIVSTLPEATIINDSPKLGFATACNIGAQQASRATYILFCHDDVAFAQDAIRKMVEEAFLMNAGVVTPKYMVWNSPNQILALGGSMDRTGTVASRVDVGDLDQGQYDISQEVFVAPGGAMLVRKDLYDAVKGFDEKMFLYYEDADLSWRVQLAGARIVAAPHARVRHLAVSTNGARRSRGGRKRNDTPVRARLARHDRLRYARRNQLRALMGNTQGGARLVSVMQYFLLSVIEALYFIVTGKPKIAFSIAESWIVLATNRPSIRKKRNAVGHYRVKTDVALRSQMIRGSARIKAFLHSRKNFKSQGEEARRVSGWRDYSSERSLLDRLTKPNLRQARDSGKFDEATSISIALGRISRILMWLVVALIAVGTRHLTVGSIPLIGQFLPFGPAHTLLATYFSGAVHSHGAIPPSPTADLILGAIGYIFLGGTGFEANMVVVALIALGLSGIFRIVADYRNRTAAYLAVVLYAISPVLGGIITSASLSGLVVYGLAPWFLIRMMRLANVPGVFRSPRLSTRYELTVEGIWLGLIVAFAPSFLFVFALISLVVGILGRFLGYLGSVKRYIATQLAAVGIALVLTAPWILSFFMPGARISALVGSAGPAHVGVLWLLLLRVSTAATVSPLFGVFLIAVGASLVFARDSRADRILTFLSVFAAVEILAVFSSYGGLGQDPIPLEVILPVGLIALVIVMGSGIEAAFAVLPRMKLGWKHLLITLSAISILVATYSMVGSVESGRYQLDPTGYKDSLGWMVPSSSLNPGRVLWLGRLGTLPIGSYQITADMAAGISEIGNPTIESMFTSANPGRDSRALEAISSAIGEDTVYLGRQLASLRIKYVVIPQSSLSNPSFLTSDLNLMLSRQRDLNQLVADPSVVAFSVQDPLGPPTTARLGSLASTLSGLRLLWEIGVAALWLGLIEATLSRRSVTLWLTRRFFATRFGQFLAMLGRLFRWSVNAEMPPRTKRMNTHKIRQTWGASSPSPDAVVSEGGTEFRHVKITTAVADSPPAGEESNFRVIDGEK